MIMRWYTGSVLCISVLYQPNDYVNVLWHVLHHINAKVLLVCKMYYANNSRVNYSIWIKSFYLLVLENQSFSISTFLKSMFEKLLLLLEIALFRTISSFRFCKMLQMCFLHAQCYSFNSNKLHYTFIHQEVQYCYIKG